MRLSELKGIGPKTEELFSKIGVNSVEELKEYYPVHYDSYTEPENIEDCRAGSKCAISVTVTDPVSMYKAGKLTIISLDVRDSTGKIRLVWYNSPFIRSVVKRGSSYVFRGNIVSKKGSLVMEHPEIFKPEQYQSKLSTLNPVYGLTKGLTNNTVVKAIHSAFEATGDVPEYLPEQIAKALDLMGEETAVSYIHFPPDQDSLVRARSRLAFDEFFLFILALRMLRQEEGDKASGFRIPETWLTEDVIERLPFRLTKGQMNVWREIEQDLSSGRRMSRLVQGDVGSGKTILAFLAMIMTASSGYQSVLMAPTEVLARQHYEKLANMCREQGLDTVRPVLLTGTLTAAERRAALEEIESGRANAIVGTHALIQSSVKYRNPALIITDEQHRFGVYQRQALAERDCPPHMLVMSATPIPRTLGVIFYGDLDISILDELPARRLPIKNCVVDPSWRPNAMKFIKREVDAGHQAYIVCPMIEPAEGLQAENVTEYTAKLKKLFPNIAIGSLHGRMKASEKNTVMQDFADGKISILVSTTVIEVGVDVPNATVMMIENAERFGLATLHQLRGRVGRSDLQSYCIFMAGVQSEDISRRLDILNHSNNGFEIAEKDFELRGPGDLLGIRQSGDAAFRIADISRDRDILKAAGELAAAVMHDDPALILEEHDLLRIKMREYMHSDVRTIVL